MDKVLVRNALQGMIRATDDDSTPIIRRLARVQARAALANLDAEAASGAGEREDDVAALAAIIQREAFRPTCRGAALDDVCALPPRPEHVAAAQAISRRYASLPPATDPAMVEAACERSWEATHTTLWRYLLPETKEQWGVGIRAALAAAPTIPATGEAVPKPLRVDWNKHDLAEAYDLVEGVRSKMAQSSESPLDTSLRAALNAIEAADCEWDGLTKTTIPATGHAATEGEGA